MEIQKNLEEKILVLSLIGEFDKLETGKFEKVVTETIDKGVYKILLDLVNVRFLDSSAVQCILQTEERLLERGGAISVARPRQTVEKVFRLLEFGKRIPVCDNLDEARGHLDG